MVDIRILIMFFYFQINWGFEIKCLVYSFNIHKDFNNGSRAYVTISGPRSSESEVNEASLVIWIGFKLRLDL